MNIRLRIRDQVFIAQVENAGERPSIHTGRQLWRAEAVMRLPLDLASAISKDGPERISADLGEGDTRSMRLRILSHSYSNGDDSAFANVELEEAEDLKAEVLEFETLSFTPYHYIEKAEANGAAVVIQAWVKTTAEQHERLRQMWADRKPEYFWVMRRGIVDEPREMRLGQPTWSRADDGFKYHLVLVDKAYDEHEKPFYGLDYPQGPNSRKSLAQLLELMDDLLEVLKNRGVLSGEDIATIRQQAEKRHALRIYDFHEVDDVDAQMTEDE